MTDGSTPQSKRGDHTLHYATWIVLRVGVPIAGALWVITELAGGLTISAIAWWAVVLAMILVFVAFHEAIKIADGRLNGGSSI